MKKICRSFLGVIIFLMAFYFLPLFVVDVKDANGRIWKGPVLSTVKEDTGEAIIFSSYRSAYALKKDGENAVHAHEEKKCRGTSYFYDADNDVSFYGAYGRSGFPNEVALQYQTGNACQGWTTNDEVAWPFGKIQDVDFQLSAKEAAEKGWLVIADGKAANPAVYNDFSNMVKQGVYCYLRAMLYEDEKLVRIVDIQMLEIEVEDKNTPEKEHAAGIQKNTGNAFQVSIRDAQQTSTDTYIRLSDQEENGERPVCVYKNNDANAEATQLFTVTMQVEEERATAVVVFK